jgi:hypothetical protein
MTFYVEEHEDHVDDIDLATAYKVCSEVAGEVER